MEWVSRGLKTNWEEENEAAFQNTRGNGPKSVESKQEYSNAYERMKPDMGSCERGHKDYEMIKEEQDILTRKLKKVTGENVRLKNILDGYKNERMQKEIDMASEVEKVYRLQEAVERKEERINGLEGLIKEMENENKEKDRKRSERISELERIFAEKEQLCTDINNEKETLLQELQLLRQENQDGMKLCKQLDSICSEFENALKNEKQKAKMKEIELKEAKSKELEERTGSSLEALQLKSEEKEGTEKLQKIEEQIIEQMKTEIEKLNNDVKAMKESKDVYAKKAEVLEQKIKNYEEDMNEKAMEIEEMNDKLIRQEKDKEEMIEENKQLKSTLLQRSQELENMTKKCEIHGQEIIRLQNNKNNSSERENEIHNEVENEKSHAKEKMTKRDSGVSRTMSEVNCNLSGSNKIEGGNGEITHDYKGVKGAEIKKEIAKKVENSEETPARPKEEGKVLQNVPEDREDQQTAILRKEIEMKEMKECIEKLNSSYKEIKLKLEKFEKIEKNYEEELRAKDESVNVLKNENLKLQQQKITIANKLERNIEVMNGYKKRNEDLEIAKRALEEKLEDFETELKKDNAKPYFEGNLYEKDNEINNLNGPWNELHRKIHDLELNLKELRGEMNKQNICNTENMSKISKLEMQKQSAVDSIRLSAERCKEISHALDTIHKETMMLRNDKAMLQNIGQSLEEQIERLQNGLSEYATKTSDQGLQREQLNLNALEELENKNASDALNSMKSDKKMLLECLSVGTFYQKQKTAATQTEMRAENTRNGHFERGLQPVINNSQMQVDRIDSREKWTENQKDVYSNNSTAIQLEEQLSAIKTEPFRSTLNTDWMMDREISKLQSQLEQIESSDRSIECKVGNLCNYTEKLKWHMSEIAQKYHSVQKPLEVENKAGNFAPW